MSTLSWQISNRVKHSFFYLRWDTRTFDVYLSVFCLSVSVILSCLLTSTCSAFLLLLIKVRSLNPFRHYDHGTNETLQIAAIDPDSDGTWYGYTVKIYWAKSLPSKLRDFYSYIFSSKIINMMYLYSNLYYYEISCTVRTGIAMILPVLFA